MLSLLWMMMWLVINFFALTLSSEGEYPHALVFAVIGLSVAVIYAGNRIAESTQEK